MYLGQENVCQVFHWLNSAVPITLKLLQLVVYQTKVSGHIIQAQASFQHDWSNVSSQMKNEGFWTVVF